RSRGRSVRATGSSLGPTARRGRNGATRRRSGWNADPGMTASSRIGPWSGVTRARRAVAADGSAAAFVGGRVAQGRTDRGATIGVLHLPFELGLPAAHVEGQRGRSRERPAQGGDAEPPAEGETAPADQPQRQEQ